MKIIRDGKEIELTYAEKRRAYDELEQEYRETDIKEKIAELGCSATEEQIEEIVWRFDNTINNDDGYWERYWMTCENVIEEVLMEEEEE